MKYDLKEPFKTDLIQEIEHSFPQTLVSLHVQMMERGLTEDLLHRYHKKIYSNLYSLDYLGLSNTVGDFFCLKEEFLNEWSSKKTFSWDYRKPKIVVDLYENSVGNLQVVWYPKTSIKIWGLDQDTDCDFRFFNSETPMFERPNNELIWLRNITYLTLDIFASPHRKESPSYDYKSFNKLLIFLIKSKYHETINILSHFYDVTVLNDIEINKDTGYTLNIFNVEERSKLLKDQENKRRLEEFKEKIKVSLSVYNVEEAKKFLKSKKHKKDQFDIWMENEKRSTLISFMKKYKKENYNNN